VEIGNKITSEPDTCSPRKGVYKTLEEVFYGVWGLEKAVGLKTWGESWGDGE